MAWVIESLATDVSIIVSEKGNLSANASGQHEPIASSMNLEGESLHAVLQSVGSWSLHKTDAPPEEIDPGGYGLYQKVSQSPESAHALLKYFNHRPPAFCAAIVLPTVYFDRVMRLLELGLSCGQRRIVVTVDFWGFREPDAHTETPTAKEFLSGQPYFGKETSFSLLPLKASPSGA
jgi:hypothetical protein